MALVLTEDSIIIRIDISEELILADFTANPLDPCWETGLHLETMFNPYPVGTDPQACTSGYTITWYKEWYGNSYQQSIN